MTADGAIRVAIQQPALPRYRIPVFAELAGRPGIDLTVLYGDEPGLENAPARGFEAVHVPGRRLGSGRWVVLWHRAQLGAARKGACDVAVLSWNTRFVSLVPALLRARRNGVSTVLWGHGYSKRESPWRAEARARVARLADGLLFYSEPAAAAYRARGWPDRRVFVAANSLDQGPIRSARQRWLADPAALAQFREAAGLGAGPILLFVSRIKPENRLDLLVEATRRLAASYPSIRTVVIGDGAVDALRSRAADAGVEDRMHLVGPQYGEERLAPWFLTADVFCYPAAIGLSLLHAFGYGLPVVTSDATSAHNPEIVAHRDGENGLRYRDGDAADLAAALDRILRDDRLRARMRAAARATVEGEFDLRSMVDGMERAIRAAAAREPGTAR